MRPIALGGCGTSCSGGCDRTICPRRDRHAVRPSAPDKLRSTMIPVNKVFFEQVFMNLTLWVWGRYGLAVGATILLGVPAVAMPSAIQISQGVSQQFGGNPVTAAAATKALTEGFELYLQGTAESLRKAIAKLEEALKLYGETSENEGQAITIENEGQALTLLLLGKVYDDLGEKQKALEYYSQSLPLQRAVGDRGGEASTLNNIGLAYSALGETQKALEYYSQSLPLQRAVGDRRGEAVTLNNIALVYLQLGEKQKALEYFGQSLPLSRAVGDRTQEALTLNNIAFAKRAQGNLTEALTDIEASLKIIESLRTKVASPELRTSYFATVQDYYQFYIDLLMELHKTQPKSGYDTKAFEASERSRARSLLELLQEA